MSVVWIVEKMGKVSASTHGALMGDYAVRVFASLNSLTMLARAKRGSRPDILVVDGVLIADAPAVHLSALAKLFGTTPVIVLTSPLMPGSAGSGGAIGFEYCLPAEGLAFSTFVEYVLTSQRGAASPGAIRYRDVLLDFDQQKVKVIPGDEEISLPLKEAQMLKMFLERPGALFSRASIASKLWGTIKVTPRTIDSHVSRLRKRLEIADIEIESVYGGGYVLK